MKLTAHAVRRYAERTGRLGASDISSKLKHHLSGAKQENPHELVRQGYKLMRIERHCDYYKWHDSNIREDVVAVVDRRSFTVLTVLTKEVHNMHTAKRKIRNDALWKRGD